MSLNCPMCGRTGCERPADGMLAFALFPPAAVMRHYRLDVPLTHLVIGLELCAEHAAEVTAREFLGDKLQELARAVERASGTAVDVDATRAVLLPFDHPDVLRLVAARKTS